MSELSSPRPTAAAPPLQHGRTRADPSRQRSLAPDTMRGLVAARNAVRDIPFSREALRAAVVRVAASARDSGASAADVTDALEHALAPALAHFPDALATELRVHVAWWAAHGYHRAD